VIIENVRRNRQGSSLAMGEITTTSDIETPSGGVAAKRSVTRFKPGFHVKVVSGTHKGKTGVVSTVDPPTIFITLKNGSSITVLQQNLKILGEK